MILVGLSRYKFRGTAKLIFGDADSQIPHYLLVGVEHQHEIFIIVIDLLTCKLEVFAQKPSHSVHLRHLLRTRLAAYHSEQGKYQYATQHLLFCYNDVFHLNVYQNRQQLSIEIQQIRLMYEVWVVKIELCICQSLEFYKIHYNRSMLQSDHKLEQDIQRSIDRLKFVIQEVSAINSIPAFYYSASLLNNYAKLNGPQACRSDLFEQFKALILQFGKRDFSQIKKNHQAIIDDILQIVDSQLFIGCLRPDIRSSKSTRNLKTQGERDQIQNNNQDYSNVKFSTQCNEAFKKKDGSPSKSMQSSVSFFISQFDQLWEMVERSYGEHNIDQAFRKASQYVEKVGKKVEIPANRQQLINTITSQYTEMINYYQEFDKPGWIFDKEEKGITLQYKVFEEEKQVAIRINGQFPIPPIEFLSIIGEIDLMGEYVPFCYDCKQLKAVSRNERLGTSKIYIPLLSDRQTYFYAVGYDRIEETGALFFYSKTINQNKAMQQKCKFEVPPPNDKFVRLQYKFFIVEYKPISKGRARITLASKVDMKMDYLPLFIINKSARIFAFDYFKNILQKVKNYKGSEWQKKVAARPDMYEFFFQKIRQKFGDF